MPLFTYLVRHIYELEIFLKDSLLPGDGFYLHQILILVLFANFVTLLASSPKSLQRLLDGLASFCDQQQLVVNLGKTQIMVFNCLKTLHLHFYFQGQEIEIASSYTYLEVKFSGPRFSLRPAIQPRVCKGMGSLAILERQCFKHHFQDTSPKLSLLSSLVTPMMLYGSVVWGPSLLDSDWASIDHVQTLFLRLGAIFDRIWFLHHLHGFADSANDRHKYSYLAYCSSVVVADSNPTSRARCWYPEAASLLRLLPC